MWILDASAPHNQATMARGGRKAHEPQCTILWEPRLAPLYLLLWSGGYPHMISRRKDVEQSVPKGDCSRHLHTPLPQASPGRPAGEKHSHCHWRPGLRAALFSPPHGVTGSHLSFILRAQHKPRTQ